jgi:NTE family protein
MQLLLVHNISLVAVLLPACSSLRRSPMTAPFNLVNVKTIDLVLSDGPANDFAYVVVIKGDWLQYGINARVAKKTIEQFLRQFGVVATELDSGQKVLFRRGNTGRVVCLGDYPQCVHAY